MDTKFVEAAHLPKGHFFFASESVCEGHPDKLCDQISDSILDACLAQDPKTKAGCEAACKGSIVSALGEITTSAQINIEQITRNVCREVGYTHTDIGLDAKTMSVLVVVEDQDPSIAKAVHKDKKDEDIGAGDQGLMFGYATDEWDKEVLHPLPHWLASRICERLAELRKNGKMGFLRPDGKSQVTLQYKREGKQILPVRIHNVLVSTQFDPSTSLEDVRAAIKKEVLDVVLPADLVDDKTRFVLNPSGVWALGGPAADAGLTGRKIIVDTYGGSAPHGGGAFSGKDGSKVDRSACYYCRYVAKSLVAAGLCHRAVVSVAYAIGLAYPLSVHVSSEGSVKDGMSDDDLLAIVLNNFDFRPGKIIQELKLNRPIFAKTAKYGHFGRMDPDFLWEFPKKDLKL